MTQAQWLILSLKIALPAAQASLLAWVAVYTRLTGGKWVHNPVGRSIVCLALLSTASMAILALSLFAHFSHLGAEIAGWVYFAVISLTVPAMLWRIVVFLRLHRADQLPVERIIALEAENAELRAEIAGFRRPRGQS